MPLGSKNCPGPEPVLPNLRMKLQAAAAEPVHIKSAANNTRASASQQFFLRRKLNMRVIERRTVGGSKFISNSFSLGVEVCAHTLGRIRALFAFESGDQSVVTSSVKTSSG